MRLLPLLVLLLVGCRTGDGLAVVYVSSTAPLEIDHLHVKANDWPAFDVGHNVRLPTSFALQVGRSFSGTVTVTVQAMDSSGIELAKGSSSVDVQPGQKTEIDIVLGVLVSQDMAIGPSPDLSTDGNLCTVGLGACASTGRIIGGRCGAVEGTPDQTYHMTAAPNGSWDWDCDGQIQYRFPRQSTDQPYAYDQFGMVHCEDVTEQAKCNTSLWFVGSAELNPSACGIDVNHFGCAWTNGVCSSSFITEMKKQACK